MKGKKFTILILVIFIAGLTLILYPSVSDAWNAHHQTQALASYTASVSELDDDQYEEVIEEINAYNQSLLEKGNRYNLSEEEEEEYNSLLNLSGTGVMGSIEIPSIDVDLPIYHGVDATILQVAAGHIPGTSLPVGGESTHAVLSAHRGLQSAKLFTDLDKVKEGDVFYIKVLDEILTYQVDQIRIVLPEEVEEIEIEEGEDLCTLVTCTPYGINTHRLLVRGHRIETVYDDGVRVSADAIKVDRITVALGIGIPMICVWVVLLFVLTGKKKGRKNETKV